MATRWRSSSPFRAVRGGRTHRPPAHSGLERSGTIDHDVGRPTGLEAAGQPADLHALHLDPWYGSAGSPPGHEILDGAWLLLGNAAGVGVKEQIAEVSERVFIESDTLSGAQRLHVPIGQL